MEPALHDGLLSFPGGRHGRGVVSVGAAKVEVVSAVLDHDGDDGRGGRLQDSAGRPRIQVAVADTVTGTAVGIFYSLLHCAPRALGQLVGLSTGA